MELTSRADMMFNLPDGSALDQDDLNGPGLGKFPRKTGDLSTDFALFKITQYAISSSITERIKFTRGLTEILLQLGKSSKEALFGIFDKIVRNS